MTFAMSHPVDVFMPVRSMFVAESSVLTAYVGKSGLTQK